ncbi:MAG: hypothetical protein AAGJ54_07165 [Planctomycetota bacterium]
MTNFKTVGFPQSVGYGVFYFGAMTSGLSPVSRRAAAIAGARKLIDKIDPRNARFDWYQFQRQSEVNPNGYPLDQKEMPIWIRQRLFEPAGINCSVQLIEPGPVLYCEYGDPNDPIRPPIFVCYESFAILDENGVPLSVQIQEDGVAVDCAFGGTLAHAVES